MTWGEAAALISAAAATIAAVGGVLTGLRAGAPPPAPTAPSPDPASAPGSTRRAPAHRSRRSARWRRRPLVLALSVAAALALVAVGLVTIPEDTPGAGPTTEPGSARAGSTPGGEPARPSHSPSGDVANDTPPIGVITSPDEDAGVRTCAYFAGTSRLPAGTTLILAKRNLTTGEKAKYVEYVFDWDRPAELRSWRGAQYFGAEAVGQAYRVELIAVDVDRARAADTAGTAAAADALADLGTVLDSRDVTRVPGSTADDCPGP